MHAHVYIYPQPIDAFKIAKESMITIIIIIIATSSASASTLQPMACAEGGCRFHPIMRRSTNSHYSSLIRLVSLSALLPPRVLASFNLLRE